MLNRTNIYKPAAIVESEYLVGDGKALLAKAA
jgi:hypothetical protein